jgi:hypothetical protein
MLKLGRCGVWLLQRIQQTHHCRKIYYRFDIEYIDNKLVAAAKEFLLM